MAVVIVHKPMHKIILSRPSGIYTAEESLTAWHQFGDTHEVSCSCDVIVDHRFVDDYEIDFAQMQTIAGLIENIVTRSKPDARMAHFCPRDLGFGMARMFEQITTARSPFRVAVFRNPKELVDWLHLSQETIAELSGETGFLRQSVSRPLSQHGLS